MSFSADENNIRLVITNYFSFDRQTPRDSVCDHRGSHSHFTGHGTDHQCEVSELRWL